jgi:hypothetical protein
MHWEKLGNIFNSNGEHPWMFSHAADPMAEHLYDDVFRIYFSSRNKNNQSHIAFADIELKAPYTVKSIHHKPALEPGEPGLYDDSGVVCSYLININGKKHLYYLAWNLAVTVPWRNTIGLAIWNEEKEIFVRHKRVPVMDRSDEDPFSISYPCILFEDGIYKMWYGSNLQWGNTQYAMKHVIKFATSTDGYTWKRNYETVIDHVHDNEYAVARPMVIKLNGLYRMWFSFRANGNIDAYRIGYAESKDGKVWTRKDDEAGIDVSASGWDSEMICYSFIFEHKGKHYMLYNGNGYGKTGIGLAVLTE